MESPVWIQFKSFSVSEEQLEGQQPVTQRPHKYCLMHQWLNCITERWSAIAQHFLSRILSLLLVEVPENVSLHWLIQSQTLFTLKCTEHPGLEWKCWLVRASSCRIGCCKVLLCECMHCPVWHSCVFTPTAFTWCGTASVGPEWAPSQLLVFRRDEGISQLCCGGGGLLAAAVEAWSFPRLELIVKSLWVGQCGWKAWLNLEWQLWLQPCTATQWPGPATAAWFTRTTASHNYSTLQLLWVHVRTNYVSNEAENAKGVETHCTANAHAGKTQKQTIKCTHTEIDLNEITSNDSQWGID